MEYLFTTNIGGTHKVRYYYDKTDDMFYFKCTCHPDRPRMFTSSVGIMNVYKYNISPYSTIEERRIYTRKKAYEIIHNKLVRDSI